MNGFIKLTEVTTRRNDGVVATWHDVETPLLINVDYIVGISEHCVCTTNGNYSVKETLEQIEEIINGNFNDK